MGLQRGGRRHPLRPFPDCNQTLQGWYLRRKAERAATSQRGAVGPCGPKKVQSRPRRQRKGMARLLIPGTIPLRHINTHALFRTKRPRRTIFGEAANRASTSQAPKPGPEAEANARRAPDAPPTEDVDGLSATNSEVESAMNHRRRRTILRDLVSPKGR